MRFGQMMYRQIMLAWARDPHPFRHIRIIEPTATPAGDPARRAAHNSGQTFPTTAVSPGNIEASNRRKSRDRAAISVTLQLPHRRGDKLEAVLHGGSTAEIAAIGVTSEPDTVAVIVISPEHPSWLDDVADAVLSGQLVIPRTVLPAVTPEQLAIWARKATLDLPAALATSLVDDMTAIARNVLQAALESSTGADNYNRRRAHPPARVQVRVFTEAPTRLCGFHVDTVAAGASPVGALRVYNGPCTEYVEPNDVRDTESFYDYLARRERLSHHSPHSAAADSDNSTHPWTLGEPADPLGFDPLTHRIELARERTQAALVALDDMPGFLRTGAAVKTVPPDATVYFRHLDVRHMWSSYPVIRTWIHRSPMAGPTRLVVNIAPAGRSPTRRSPV